MMFSVVFLISLFGSSYAVTGISQDKMFTWGSQVGDTVRNVHGLFTQAALLDWYDQVTIPNSLPSFKIYGKDLGRKVFINYNGHITFGGNWKNFNPFTVNQTDASVLAIFNVFYSDNDLRRSPGLLYYRVTSTTNDLSDANTLIRQQGFKTFTSSYCIIATWTNLKYYVRDEEDRPKPGFQQENTYQEVLCTDGNDGHYIYHYNKLEWGRSQDTKTNYATVGWHVKGATSGLVYWVAPHSGSAGVQGMATGSNVGVNGRWMRSQAVVGPCVGLTNDVYPVNCTHYKFCCNERQEKVASCPEKSFYHPTLKMCVGEDEFKCGGANFCTGKSDGNHAYTTTPREDDFYRCRSGVGMLLLCPHNNVFGSSARCR